MTDEPQQDEKTEPQDEKLDSGLFGTAKINPDQYSAQKNTNFFARTKYAVAGLIHVLVRQVTTRSLIIETVILFGLALWLRSDLFHWAVLVMVVGNNWLAEMLNTAIEATVDLATEGEIHPMAKVAKDVAAAVTLFAFLLTVIVSLLLFLPALVERFS